MGFVPFVKNFLSTQHDQHDIVYGMALAIEIGYLAVSLHPGDHRLILRPIQDDNRMEIVLLVRYDGAPSPDPSSHIFRSLIRITRHHVPYGGNDLLLNDGFGLFTLEEEFL